MEIVIYIKDNQLVSKINSNNNQTSYTTESTIKFLDKLQTKTINNVVLKDNVVTFVVDGLNVRINDYNRLKNISYLYKINEKIPVSVNDKKNNAKEKLKQSKNIKLNRALCVGIGTCVVVFGMAIFAPKKNTVQAESNYQTIKPSEDIKKTPEEDEYEIVESTDDKEIEQNLEEEVKQEVPIEEKEIEPNFTINLFYEDLSETEKAINTKENYGDIIAEYANMYGIDPNLMIALATQERGTHSSVMDSGGATGIMQIQNSVFVGHTIEAFNYKTNSYDKLSITNENIGDLETNIQAGCMIFQKNLNYMDNNLLATLQCYNMGYGNMDSILSSYQAETGLSKKEILNNPEDLGWLDCRKQIFVGDQNYVEHVLSWLGTDKYLTMKTEDGSSVILNVKNKANVRLS